MKDKILEAAMRVYYKKGARFTMDDLAAELSMSKKTIYTVFRDKKTLLYDMVDFAFDQIKESEAAILGNNSLGIEEKLQGILSVCRRILQGLIFLRSMKWGRSILRLMPGSVNVWKAVGRPPLGF